MIKYIVGRTNTGKTEYMAQEMKSKLDDMDRELIMIVPEQFTLEAEREIIEKMNVEGILNLQVLSFSRLFHIITENYATLDYGQINDIGKAMALRGIFEKHRDEFKVYKKISSKKGFISEFITRMNEFKRNGITVERMGQVSEGLNEHPFLKNKLEDIALGIKYFNDYYGENFKDDEDRYEIMAGLIKTVTFLKGAHIWIDGFQSFSHQEYSVIRELFYVAEDVSISITTDDDPKIRDGEVFTHSLKTLEQLEKLATEASLEWRVERITHLDNTEPKGLRAIKSELFAYPYEKCMDHMDGLDIYICDNYYDEIELVAQKITSLVNSGQYVYKDISVLTADLGTYGSIINRVFNDFCIPKFIDIKESTMNNPVVIYILSAMSIVEKGFRTEDIFRYIKTGLTEISDHESEQLETFVIEKGISGKRWLEAFYCESEEACHTLNNLREKIILPLVKLNKKIKGKITIKDRVTALYTFICEEDLDEKIAAYKEKFIELKLYGYSYQYTQLWNNIMAIFDQLVELEGDTVKSLGDFYLELEAGFTELKLSIIPPTENQVFIGDFHRSKSSQVKATFVIGMNDGVIPGVNRASDLLVDEEKQILKEQDLLIKTDSNTISQDEVFKFYIALAKPTEYLWFSYSGSDVEGKALRPSIYFEKMKQIFEKYNEKSSVDYIIKSKALAGKLALNLRGFLDGESVDEKWFGIAKAFGDEAVWGDTLENIKSGLVHNNQLYKIDQIKAKELYSIPLKTSVSRLEKYAGCPFAHFIKYGLRPSERKPYEIGMPDVGNLFHTTVDAYSREIEKLNLQWTDVSPEKMGEIVDRIVDSTVEDYGNQVFKSTYRYQYLINKIKRIGKRSIETLTEQLTFGTFKPEAYELAFSESGGQYAVPPIVIELDSGDRVYIEGRIDRVDMLDLQGAKYVKIIDYKSGNAKLSLSDIYLGFQMQLMVYLNAIIDNSQYFREDHLNPGGIFYFKIDDPLIDGDSINKSQVEQEIFKRLKMDGLVVSDIKIATAIDHKIEDRGKSDIISYEVKKDGDVSARSQALELEDFNNLMKHVRSNIKRFSTEILEGRTEINPVKEGSFTSCDYCEYKGICQFDVKIEDNNYNNIKALTKEEVIEKIRDTKGDK